MNSFFMWVGFSVQIATFVILVFGLAPWLYDKYLLPIRAFRLGLDFDVHLPMEWPPAGAEGRGEERKLLLVGRATYYFRLRARHGVTVDYIDLRFVKRRWAWPPRFWRWEAVASDLLTVHRVDDSVHAREAPHPTSDPSVRDNKVGGKIMRFRNPYNLLAHDSLWLEMEVEVHGDWEGRLELMGPTNDRRRAYSRIRATGRTE